MNLYQLFVFANFPIVSYTYEYIDQVLENWSREWELDNQRDKYRYSQTQQTTYIHINFLNYFHYLTPKKRK